MADTEKIIAMTRSELVELVRQILAEIPDVTGYAKTTDIPSSLPANGGNADTIDHLHIWKGTQAQFDAIRTKDANTIYLIKEG